MARLEFGVMDGFDADGADMLPTDAFDQHIDYAKNVMPKKLVEKSMRLMGDEVIPAFR